MSTPEINPNAPGLSPVQGFLNPSQIETLPESDPRRELFDQLKSGSTQPGDDTPGGQVLQFVKDSSPNIRFTDLPVELASAILSSQHEGIMSMLRGWAESIEHNAQEDKKASLTAQEMADLIKKQQESRSLLAPVLQKAVNTGALSESAAQELRDRAGFAVQHPEVPVAQVAASQETNPAIPQLQEPEDTGVQLRPLKR